MKNKNGTWKNYVIPSVLALAVGIGQMVICKTPLFSVLALVFVLVPVLILQYKERSFGVQWVVGVVCAFVWIFGVIGVLHLFWEYEWAKQIFYFPYYSHYSS